MSVSHSGMGLRALSFACALAFTACGDDSGSPSNGPDEDADVPDGQAGNGGMGGDGDGDGDASADDAAAGAGGDGSLDASSDSGEDDRALVASVNDRYVTETGVVERPVDLAELDLTVLVLEGDAFSSHPPTITGPGAFENAALPEGDRYIRYAQLGGAPTYVVTNARTVDLGATHLGRPDVLEASEGTQLAFDVTGLEAWEESDGIDLYCAGANDIRFDANIDAAGAPQLDDVALSDFTVDFDGSGNTRLIDGDEGDRAYLVQRSLVPFGSEDSYAAVRRALALPSFSMTDGETTTISGALVAPPADTLELDWKASELEEELLTGNPGQTLAFVGVGVFAQPNADLGFFAPTVDLMLYVPESTGDVVGTFDFGNPFPASYTLVVGSLARLFREYAVEGATPLSQRADVDTRVVIDAAAMTLAPLLGPVANLSIDGRAAQVDVAETGTSPEITFDAPTTGEPSGYEIRITRLYNDAGATAAAFVGRIITEGRNVVVPPGLMANGQSYFIEVIAFREGDANIATEPLATGYPRALASALSGVITP